MLHLGVGIVIVNRVLVDTYRVRLVQVSCWISTVRYVSYNHIHLISFHLLTLIHVLISPLCTQTPNCTRIVVEDEFKALVEDPVVFAKYARFKRNAELSRNPAVRWCQTPGCEV